MAPRVKKKPKTKKQQAVPQDLEFMLGEEIPASQNSTISTEAEHSLLDASSRARIPNIRLAGLTQSRLPIRNNSIQTNQITNANSHLTRFIPEIIPEEPELDTNSDINQNVRKSNSKKKSQQKKSKQSDQTENYPSDDSTLASMRHQSNEECVDATGHDDTAPLMHESQSQSDASDSTVKKSIQSKKSSERRKSTSPKKLSSRDKSQSRKTISNDRDIQILRDIAHLQASTQCLIPKLSFARLIREIIQGYSSRSLSITVECLQCLQEAAEIYAVQVMEDAYRCTLHRGRITLTGKDMRLALLLRNDSVMMN